MIEYTIKQGTRLVFKEEGKWACVSGVDAVVAVIEDERQTPMIHVDYVLYDKNGVPIRIRKGLPLGALLSAIDAGAIIEVRNPETGDKR